MLPRDAQGMPKEMLSDGYQMLSVRAVSAFAPERVVARNGSPHLAMDALVSAGRQPEIHCTAWIERSVAKPRVSFYLYGNNTKAGIETSNKASQGARTPENGLDSSDSTCHAKCMLSLNPQLALEPCLCP